MGYGNLFLFSFGHKSIMNSEFEFNLKQICLLKDFLI